MSIQDHSNGSDSSMLLPGGNPDGQTVTGGGHVPKIRKPYTITKQRERWTEEEHKKFLEALKLYGRAWRKIEDHVGTKNAVQIRSHAQKFFSKVARESKSSNSGSIKPMEIPPPRPKRKPMHPYPRKLVIPVKKDRPLQEQSARSTSPNSSVDQENQSPTSVLSTFASEALQFEDSSTPDGSSSPMSSHDIVNYHGIHIPSCDDPMVQENIYQVDEPISVKLEIFPKSSLEVTSVKVLKLFGQTMFLEDPQKTDPASVCLDQQAVVSAELPAIRYTHTSPQPMEASPSAPVPLRSFCGSMPFPFIQLNSINSTKETLKQNFFSGFTAGSINAASNCHMNQDTGTQIHECSLGSTAIQQISAPAPQSKLGANLKRASSERYTRAFVPYKRSLSEKGTQSSTITNDENNDLQRTRLCF